MSRRAAVFAAVWIVLGAGPVEAALLSKVYVFQSGATLDIGESVEPSVRLDSVRFAVPASGGQTSTRTSGPVQAEIAVSNTGASARTVGIAVALFDDAGRLLGVASGGDRMFPLKAQRQAVYRLSFDFVNAEAARAVRFHISLETRP
jgi:hypothetical protein